MTTQLSPVVQRLLSHTLAEQRVLPASLGWVLSFSPGLPPPLPGPTPTPAVSEPLLGPVSWLSPPIKKPNGPWRQVLACLPTHPCSLLIPPVADMTSQPEVSDAEGSKRPGVSQILLPFP